MLVGCIWLNIAYFVSWIWFSYNFHLFRRNIFVTLDIRIFSGRDSYVRLQLFKVWLGRWLLRQGFKVSQSVVRFLMSWCCQGAVICVLQEFLIMLKKFLYVINYFVLFYLRCITPLCNTVHTWSGCKTEGGARSSRDSWVLMTDGGA